MKNGFLLSLLLGLVGIVALLTQRVLLTGAPSASGSAAPWLQGSAYILLAAAVLTAIFALRGSK